LYHQSFQTLGSLAVVVALVVVAVAAAVVAAAVGFDQKRHWNQNLDEKHELIWKVAKTVMAASPLPPKPLGWPKADPVC
jgi:uncharacterized membrane protein